MEQHLLSTNSQHFFKVLISDFHQKLRLPPAFCLKVTEENSKSAILKTRKGTWKVKVSRDSGGVGISFERRGWPEFVESHHLSVGDFLVFQHLGRFEFNVLVFDPTCCEKEFPVEHNEDHPHRFERANNNEELAHFITTMQPLHALRNGHLNIPIGFIRSNNLKNKTSADVKDELGQVWTMNLVTQTTDQFRIHMGKGWLNFYRSKKLKNGDVCVFYLSSNLPNSPTMSFDVKINPSS